MYSKRKHNNEKLILKKNIIVLSLECQNISTIININKMHETFGTSNCTSMYNGLAQNVSY